MTVKNNMQWVQKRLRFGWLTLGIGVLVSALGIESQLRITNRPYDFRIIVGLGILLIGIGIAAIVRYSSAAKDEAAAKRAAIEANDERTVFIRAKAGSRAYWVSTALVYLGLMWVSFASNGQLPRMNDDILWYFLAFTAVVPFGVYLYSIVRDENNS
jgi:glycopeptide antibiotics resistance protein